MSKDNPDLKGINAVMTEKLKESLSALYDGEAEQLEARRALKSGASEPELETQWEHYSLIGDVIRGQGDGVGQIDLSAGVMQALESSEGESTAKHSVHWSRRWYAQAAVAAGVAFTLMIGLNTQPAETPVLAEQAPIEFSPATISNPLALQAGVAVQQQMQTPAAQAIQAQLQKEIEAYIIRHAEHSAASGQQGLLPLARVMETDQESQ